MSKELDNKIKNEIINNAKLFKSVGIEADDMKYLIQILMIGKKLEYTGDIEKDSKTVEEFYNKKGININIDEMVSEIGE